MLYVVGEVCRDKIVCSFSLGEKSYEGKIIEKPGMAGNALLANAALRDCFSKYRLNYEGHVWYLFLSPFTCKTGIFSDGLEFNVGLEKHRVHVVRDVYLGTKQHVVYDDHYETVRSVDRFRVPRHIALNRVKDKLQEYPSNVHRRIDWQQNLFDVQLPKERCVCLVYNYGKTRGLINHLIDGFANVPVSLFVLDGSKEGIRETEKRLRNQGKEVLIPSDFRRVNGSEPPVDIPGDGDIHSFITANMLCMSDSVDEALNKADSFTRSIQYALFGIGREE